MQGFRFTEEQSAFRNAIRDFCKQECGTRAQREGQDHRDRQAGGSREFR